MNRFESRKHSMHTVLRSTLLFLFLAFLIVFFILAINTVDQATTAKQQESLEGALNRCVTQCYAIEGTYPPSLQYMKQHYGLTYDDSIFFVDYQTFGANIMPDITVIRKN